jgi:hypothetical protein
MVLYSDDSITLDRNNQFPTLLFPSDKMGGSLHGQDQAQRYVPLLQLNRREADR